MSDLRIVLDNIDGSSLDRISGIIVYNREGKIIVEKYYDISELEYEFIETNFRNITVEFYNWINGYDEITLFRGLLRATFVKMFDSTFLFVSDANVDIKKVQSCISSTIKQICLEILKDAKNKPYNFREIVGNIITDYDKVLKTVEHILKRMNIDPNIIQSDINSISTSITSEKSEQPLSSAKEIDYISSERRKKREYDSVIYDTIKPFDESIVPTVEKNQMSEEILTTASKKAIKSLLFSIIKATKYPSAATYIYPKNHGTIAEIYVGNIAEKKILYVLETLSKYPRVINEILESEEENKILNAGDNIVQVILENCREGKLLIGITSQIEDVSIVAKNMKVIREIIIGFGF